MDELFLSPVVTTPDTARKFDIKAQAAQRHIDRLVEHGILVEVTKKDYKRVWVARDLLTLVERRDED